MPSAKAMAQPVANTREYNERLAELAKNTRPTVFTLRAKLPTQGRADMPVAATDKMTVILKAYASGGENTVHAHPYEDHTFVVLQGTATFFDEEGQIGELGRHQGILLPRGAFYRFQAGVEEPLVMLRLGTTVVEGADPNDRIAVDGRYMDGFSEENKEVEVLYESEAVFE